MKKSLFLSHCLCIIGVHIIINNKKHCLLLLFIFHFWYVNAKYIIETAAGANTTSVNIAAYSKGEVANTN